LTFPSAVLVVLDGWGLAPDGEGNAISRADTPVMDRLWSEYPHGQLRTSGEDVGLPHGQMGNSEVGHLNLGAGAIVPQDLKRIDDAVADGSFAANEALVAAMEGAERVHLVGLVSDGGVHSSLEHLRALQTMAHERGVPDLVIHAFTDGRDTSPTAGAGYVETVEGVGSGRVATVCGRYYGMDRDSREERTQRALELLVHGRAEHRANTGVEAVRMAYGRDETDEFIAPTIVADEGRIRSGDSVICFNFRPDRMRQIVTALAEHVERITTMTQYEEDYTFPVAFPPHRPKATLPHVVAGAGLRQLHVAETEKYPHVTYFFGGGEEDPETGEERALVPSPRDVPTYDHKPAMSAPEAAKAFCDAWRDGDFGFGIINFANADMVGHTGSIPAAIEAVETVDRCLGEVVAAVEATGGVCVVTADHGNADNMLEPDGSPNTAHSLNPVPFVITSHDVKVRDEGILADVAPTMLELLGIDRPEAMTGESMLR
jgi:2,3-bisphosphoglycerate-independent phosphoglycerate mutase